MITDRTNHGRRLRPVPFSFTVFSALEQLILTALDIDQFHGPNPIGGRSTRSERRAADRSTDRFQAEATRNGTVAPAPTSLARWNKALLSAADISSSGDAAGFVVWDRRRNGPVTWRREDGFAEDDVDPAPWGRYEFSVADGSIAVLGVVNGGAKLVLRTE